MRRVKVDIQKPIWNGGKPHVGVADWRIKNADEVVVEIGYTRKDGTRSYPDNYVMSVEKLMSYPTQIVGGGTKLFVAPLSDWQVEGQQELL